MPLKFFLIAISLIAMAGEAKALGRMADVALYDRTENRTLPVYFHDGRYYVAGKPGNDYQITLRNRQPAEIMTVISVDGINAVTGETAHWSQGGYVLGAAAAYAIGGWRKNLHSVARFYFTELDASYAARSARPETSFERAAAVPDEVITIYYDSYQNLLARGVIRPPAMAHPSAFPGRFVPDPS